MLHQGMMQHQAATPSFDLLQRCQSVAMAQVRRQIERVGRTDCRVLVEGETGVSKELVARAIHECSSRRNAPYVVADCTLYSRELILSQLFGHEAGAFTGANERHLGLFEVANGGTIFLDEIAELPLDLQPVLLRVLETGTFMRLGGSRQVKTDVRVVAAANRSLRALVMAGGFREDLYYRLQAFPIAVPPLRERVEDILDLAEFFLSQDADERRRLSPAAQEKLRSHNWPGNVRELASALRTAMVLAPGDLIEDEHLHLQQRVVTAPPEDPFGAVTVSFVGKLPLPKLLARVEQAMIEFAYREAEHDAERAARVLGISSNELRSRMRELGLWRSVR